MALSIFRREKLNYIGVSAFAVRVQDFVIPLVSLIVMICPLNAHCNDHAMLANGGIIDKVTDFH